MAYEKQTWAKGDVVTSTKLNHIEDGIAAAESGGGGGRFVITADKPTGTSSSPAAVTADKSLAEIVAAMEAGMTPVVKFKNASSPAGDQYFFASLKGYNETDGDITTMWFVSESRSAGSFAGYNYVFTSSGVTGNTFS